MTLEHTGHTPDTGVDAELLRQAEGLGPSSSSPPPAGAPTDGRPAELGGPAPVDYQGDARELVNFIYHGVTPAWPTLAPIYTPEVRERLAGSIGRVMAKYQLSLADIFKQWAPEISFAMVALPLVPPTVAAIREQRAADRAAAELAKQAAAQKQANPNAAAPAST